MYICTYVHMYICTYVHMCVHMCTYVGGLAAGVWSVLDIYVCIYACTVHVELTPFIRAN